LNQLSEYSIKGNTTGMAAASKTINFSFFRPNKFKKMKFPDLLSLYRKTRNKRTRRKKNRKK